MKRADAAGGWRQRRKASHPTYAAAASCIYHCSLTVEDLYDYPWSPYYYVKDKGKREMASQLLIETHSTICSVPNSSTTACGGVFYCIGLARPFTRTTHPTSRQNLPDTRRHSTRWCTLVPARMFARRQHACPMHNSK